MAVGIIILNYNSASYTIQCIQSIEKHNSAIVKYIIVDNGSTKEGEVITLASYLESAFPVQFLELEDTSFSPNIPKVCLVASKSNDGYAQGNNKGLRILFEDSDIDDILILNNDVFFESDIIPELLSMREQMEKPGILTPVLYNLDGGIEHNCARRFPSNWEVMLPFILFKKDVFHILSHSSKSQKIFLKDPNLLYEPVIEVGMPSGSFMFIGKDLLRKMNGLDKGTFLYYEENILCKRLSIQGYHCYCVTSVHARHVGGASTSNANNLFLQRCNLESADYYLGNYASLSFLQRIVWNLVFRLWSLKFKIKGFWNKDGAR